MRPGPRGHTVLVVLLVSIAGCSDAPADATQASPAPSEAPEPLLVQTGSVPMMVLESLQISNDTGLVELGMNEPGMVHALVLDVVGDHTLRLANRDPTRTSGPTSYGVLLWRGVADGPAGGLGPCTPLDAWGMVADAATGATHDLGLQGSRLDNGTYVLWAWSSGYDAPWTLSFGGPASDTRAQATPLGVAANLTRHVLPANAHGDAWGPPGLRMAIASGTYPTGSDGEWERRITIGSPTCTRLEDSGRTALTGGGAPARRHVATLLEWGAAVTWDLRAGPATLPAGGPSWTLDILQIPLPQ